MNYQEIKDRLTKCENTLISIKNGTYNKNTSVDIQETRKKLEVLKESLQKQLIEADKTAFVNGQPVEYTDEKELQKFKDNVDVKSIKTAAGRKLKEAEGYEFSKEETTSIAKEVGKAVAKALRTIGDEVAHMKAHHIEPNSFEIHVEYKKDTITDDFSFYISGDTLHLVDFSFDKEIGDVGVKPSGEAIVHVDVLANELIKHFKSNMKEGMTDQEWADAQEKERLDQHPEKSTIEKIQALIAAQKPKTVKEVVKTTSWSRYKKLKDRGVSVQFVTKDELNPPENKSNTPKVKEASSEEEEKFHKKLDTLVHKTFGKREEEMNEAPEGMYYIKVAVRDARKALAIIDDQPALRNAVEIDGSDTYYLSDEELAYDLLQDFLAQDIEVTDNNIELEEATDYQRRREAESDYKVSKKDKPAKAYKEPKNDYFARRKAEMDEESISSHDPHLAQAILDLIDSHAATAGLTDEAAKDEIIDFIKKQKVNEGEVDAQQDGADLDVGHQDDEPSMLKKDLYDIATYAAKLYKQLDKYDKYDGEVDFPHWWQKKVALSREYISSAQHYLEAEEKQPAIDQLALEGEGHRSEVTGANEYDELIGGIIRRLHGLQKYVAANQDDLSDELAAIVKAFDEFDDKMAYGTEMDEDAKERVARAAAAAKELSTKVAFGKFDTEHGEMDSKKTNLRKYIARPGALEEQPNENAETMMTAAQSIESLLATASALGVTGAGMYKLVKLLANPETGDIDKKSLAAAAKKVLGKK